MADMANTARAIITYKDTTSGMHWDNMKGASISGDAATSAWNNYLAVSKVQFYLPFLVVHLSSPLSAAGQ